MDNKIKEPLTTRNKNGLIIIVFIEIALVFIRGYFFATTDGWEVGSILIASLFSFIFSLVGIIVGIKLLIQRKFSFILLFFIIFNIIISPLIINSFTISTVAPIFKSKEYKEKIIRERDFTNSPQAKEITKNLIW